MFEKITLSGFAGSGKSTVGKIIAEKLNFKFISVGDFSREFAMNEFNMTINAFQAKCKTDPSLDKLIDDKFRQYCNSNNNLIIDYRLGFRFVENALHVFLRVSDEEAFNRISKAKRSGEEVSIEAISKRNLDMKNRFFYTYGADFTDEKNYHLVIDVNKLRPLQIAELIIDAFDKLKKDEAGS